MTKKEKKLGEISHTNPYTNRTFGDTQVYERGKTIAADGGESEPNEDESDHDHDHEPETLADVSHASPDDENGAQRTFDRGVDR